MGGLPADRCKVPRVIWRAMEALGIDLSRVLAEAGLSPTLLTEPDEYATTTQLFAFFRVAEQLSGDPALGIKVLQAADADSAAYPPALIAAYQSPTYREGIERVVQFKRLGRAEELYVEEARDEVAITKRWLHTAEPEPALCGDLTFGLLVELGRRGTGQRITPLRVELARTGPRNDALASYYGCPVLHDAERDRLVLRASDLALRFPRHHPELLSLLVPALAAALEELDVQGSVGEQVKWALKRRLTQGRHELADIASDLRMSERTLQRRITEEGTTFRNLLLEARRELGRQLLRGSTVSIDEVAFLLGYQDRRSFYRAFREWEGTTPARWREQHGGLA